MRELVDVHYPDAACIRVVQDNLSTHSAGSLYEAFAPPRPGEFCAAWSSITPPSLCYECHDAFLTRLNRLTGSLFVGAVRCAAQAVLASPLMARRASVQMRSTIEANPFERCGVKCSANPRRRNTPCTSIRTISSAHRPE